MDELQKIYYEWSEEHGTSQQVRDIGCRILKSLHPHCSDDVLKAISSDVISYGCLIEEQAFCAGYRHAFALWIQIMSEKH